MEGYSLNTGKTKCEKTSSKADAKGNFVTTGDNNS